MLRNNGGDDLTLTANGSFAFATKLAGGGAYDVTVKTNPSGQSCSVANGTGTIAAADVTNVAVTCADSASASAAATTSIAPTARSGRAGLRWTTGRFRSPRRP